MSTTRRSDATFFHFNRSCGLATRLKFSQRETSGSTRSGRAAISDNNLLAV